MELNATRVLSGLMQDTITPGMDLVRYICAKGSLSSLKSEHHFQMAFQIIPCSSIIMSYLGSALHALKRSQEALLVMEKAILADKKNPLPMYQKANILVSLEKLGEALEDLEELKEYAPLEAVSMP